jgi:predicted aspartyl protease
MPMLLNGNQVLATVDSLATKSFMSESIALQLGFKTRAAPLGSVITLASGETTKKVLWTEPLELHWKSPTGLRVIH